MNYATSIPVSEVTEEKKASVCPAGHDIPHDAPMGLCPECLFGIALEAPQESKRFGEYELLEEMGRGGMGVVYKAQHVVSHRVEALKMILNGELASDEEVYRFHLEAQAASSLDRPNIVPIYQVGEVDGRHYFTMKWMRGGSLADHIDKYREDPRRAAELLETIALAVHDGHDHAILHRDLKPANILLDEHGTPHVADFGLAKRLDPHGDVQTRSGIFAGTPEYMAPEQLDGQGKSLTRAIDVWSMGVILFEILTGRRPFIGKTTEEIVQKVVHQPAPNPQSLDPRIDLDLTTICLRCLEKHAENRYRSAIELARDLRKYLNGESIKPEPQAKRAWRWCKREPFKAALVVETVLLLVVATLAVFSGAAAQEKDRREEVLRANEYAARWVAGTVLFKLNSYHDIVAQAARDFPPELFASLPRKEIHVGDAMEGYCKDLVMRYGTSGGRMQFHSFFLVGADGLARARWPVPKYPAEYANDYLGKDYVWRDYFKGAWKLAEARSRGAYISRTIFSEASKTRRFAISAPIYNEKTDPIGVIVAMTDTGTTLGTLALKDPSDNRHIAMVVAPRDNERETRDDPLPKDHVILVHDSLPGGKTAFLKNNLSVRKAVDLADASNPNRGLSQLLLADPNAATSEDGFCDPVMAEPCEDASGKTKAGRWLAGFAPIGNTGFVAIVETPREAAAQPNQTLARRLLLWGVLPFMVGTALVAAVVGYGRRKGQRVVNRSAVVQP